MSIATGTILRHRYKILQVLGSGGFGETYLAEDLDLPGKPQCVVKHLKINLARTQLQIVRRLFDSEAKILHQLGRECDRIPRLFAHFEEAGQFYLVQEFVAGGDLSGELAAGKKLSESYVRRLLRDILEVLDVAHQRHVIHRDIKPANLIRRQSDGKIVLIDFGAVKQVGTQMVNPTGQTSLSVAIGTPGYMPSEQGIGKPKLCSDIYAVGMVGIQALAGIEPINLPDDPMTGEVVWRNRAAVSDELAAILDKMVRQHWVDRYKNAAEVLQVLNPGSNPVSHPTSGHQTKSVLYSPPPKLARRTALQWLAFGGVGFAIAVALDRFGERTQPSVSNSVSESAPVPEVEPPEVQVSEVASAAPPEPEPVPIEEPEPEPVPEPEPAPIEEPEPASETIPTSYRQSFETVTVNARGEIIDRRQVSAEVWGEDLDNDVILEMVKIPGGRFFMGSPETEKRRRENEGPQHWVTVPEFSMGKYPVTQAQWRAVAALPKVSIDLSPAPSKFKGNNRPVEKVSWHQAVEFCQRLSIASGRDYRLPSEAEWEYVCRAGTTTPFFFGETITTDLANYNGNYTYALADKGEYRKQTTEVGRFPPNAFGIYDMHGNVWEWCADDWHDNYEGAPDNGSIWLSGNRVNLKVLRGGSWFFIPDSCRSAFRIDFNSAHVFYLIIGFRVLCAAPGTS